jgi:DNA-binding response OmpR family regulator
LDQPSSGPVWQIQRMEERVLLVEDDRSIRETTELGLRQAGFRVTSVGDGREALVRFRREPYQLVILDLMLPTLDGFEVCREIRKESQVPIVMLSARTDTVDIVVGLELGADDYVTKPFSPRELAARVRTVLRRASPAPDAAELLTFEDLEIDAGAREVRQAGELLRLTAKEFDLLWFLASHPRRVFSRDQLMQRVWGYSSALDTGTVTVHVRRLREKIEADASQPRRLETVWGVGYRFNA